MPIYRSHYSRRPLKQTLKRLEKAGYEEGTHYWLEETDGKTTHVHLAEGLIEPEHAVMQPWRVTIRRADGEELTDTYSARRPDQAASWFRRDETWRSGLECEVVEVVPVQ